MYIKAVYTVEAALLVPWILLLFLTVLHVTDSLHKESVEIVAQLETQKVDTKAPQRLWAVQK
jgi:hypothetical protein